ncbi:MAG: addiction module toxin RelE [Chthoniobacterales bacterium]|nr:MAG: addiction module toxin RelE [Chthoniobacterales bacterium]
MNLIFKPEAERDLTEAYEWYEERDKGLGSEFIRAVDTCASQIQRHPEMYPVAYRDVRQAVTRRFPYSIFYLVEEDTVVIVSVFHASRDPRIGKAAPKAYYSTGR